MKSVFLIFSLSVFLNLNAQNLTMSELLRVKKMDVVNVEEFLTSKGWEYESSKPPQPDSLGKISFIYNKSKHQEGFAESFITYYYKKDLVRLNIKFHKNNKYNEYLNAIKGYGCKLIGSNISEDGIFKYYQGETTTFEIITTTSENSNHTKSNVWDIFIFDNEEYDYIYGLNFNGTSEENKYKLYSELKSLELLTLSYDSFKIKYFNIQQVEKMYDLLIKQEGIDIDIEDKPHFVSKYFPELN